MNKIIIHVITGLGDGGAEAVLYRLCTFDANFTHIVISLMDEGKYGISLRKAGIDVYCLNNKRGRISFNSLFKLWMIFRKYKNCSVQTWMYHANLVGGIIARLAGINKIFWGIHHTSLDYETNKSSSILVAKLCAKLSKIIPTKIICCAQKSLEIHQKLGYDANKLIVISNGYNLNNFSINDKSREKIKQELNIGQEWVLGMIGRFDPLKDHVNLLNALKIVKENNIKFRLLLAGANISKENLFLMDVIKDCNLVSETHLLGQRSDIPDIMNALDVHVLSSYSEAFPNVVAEAMACGTPCVVTDVGDSSLIVGNTGWVVPAKNSEALATALVNAKLAMENVDEWNKIRYDARQRIEKNFSLQEMVKNYCKVWQE